MKKIICFMSVGILFLMQAGLACADSKSFVASVTMPMATSVSIQAFKVTESAGNVEYSPVDGNVLSFDPVTYNQEFEIYQPDHYFVIQTGLAQGSGSQDVVVNYAEGVNPNSPKNGLGWKAQAAFAKATGKDTEEPLVSHSTKLLKDLNNENITAAELGSNGLKIYVGIVTDPAKSPAGAEVFSNGDRPGIYDGIITVTATVS